MGQGQTTRNRLSIRAGEHDIPGAMRDIQRWADRLPLGAAGFHATNTANQTFAAGASGNLTFDTMLYDKEKWKTTSSTFTVPQGLSGVYVLSAETWFSVTVTGIYLSITVNGVAIKSNDTSVTAAEETDVCHVYPLKERDVISLHMFNNSAALNGSFFFAGNVNIPKVPYLSAWRISLL